MKTTSNQKAIHVRLWVKPVITTEEFCYPTRTLLTCESWSACGVSAQTTLV